MYLKDEKSAMVRSSKVIIRPEIASILQIHCDGRYPLEITLIDIFVRFSIFKFLLKYVHKHMGPILNLSAASVLDEIPQNSAL